MLQLSTHDRQEVCLLSAAEECSENGSLIDDLVTCARTWAIYLNLATDLPFSCLPSMANKIARYTGR